MKEKAQMLQFLSPQTPKKSIFSLFGTVFQPKTEMVTERLGCCV